MAKENAYKYDYTKYIGAKLEYKLAAKQDTLSKKWNDENLDVIADALDRAGILLKVADDKITIEIDSDKYISSSIRNAGAKDNKIVFPNNKYGCKGDTVQYSDIVYMMNDMTDKEIMTALHIPYATYYRHKKVLLNSDYYDTIDQKKTGNLEYLKDSEFALMDMHF